MEVEPPRGRKRGGAASGLKVAAAAAAGAEDEDEGEDGKGYNKLLIAVGMLSLQTNQELRMLISSAWDRYLAQASASPAVESQKAGVNYAAAVAARGKKHELGVLVVFLLGVASGNDLGLLVGNFLAALLFLGHREPPWWHR